jgi:hypothetical protein
VDDHPIDTETDSDEVDPLRAGHRGQAPHPLPLPSTDGIDRITVTGDGPHLRHHSDPVIDGK